MSLPRLHLTTNDEVLRRPGFSAVARSVLRCCGAYCALHLRGHGMSGAELHEMGEALAAAALRTGSWLIVNDRVDVAMAVRANGVQLGARSLETADARAVLGAGAQIGASTHGAPEVAQAELDGADFAVLGNIFETASHPGRTGLGPAEIARARASTALPVLGIGGITPLHLGELASAGAYGVVVLGGVWHAADPVEAAAEYVASMDAAWSKA